jgi:hypothetical protein
VELLVFIDMKIKEEPTREVSKEYDRWKYVCSFEVDFVFQ